MKWCVQAAVAVLTSLAVGAAAQECSLADVPEQSVALMQRAKSAHGMLQAARADRKKAREAERKKAAKNTARVDHSGTVSLLMTQMNDMIATKGQVGMTPDEIEHIHGIKALIDDTILPTIMETVAEARRELEILYQDILACSGKHVLNFSYSTEMSYDDPKVVNKETMTECIKHEDELITWTEQACEEMNRTRLEIMLPDGFDMPPPSVPDEEMIEYLKLMDEFFCGTYEVWHEQYTKCEDLQKNYTNTKASCKRMQKTYEEQQCSVSTQLSASCGDLDTCYIEAVKAYNEKKKAVLDSESLRISEYEGAVQIDCLWGAWIYEYMPCTVNKTRVKECHEIPPNLTNITIEFPPPPTAPDCGDEAFHAAMGSTPDSPVEVCSEEWTKLNYAELGLHQGLIAELEDACEPCPTKTWTSAPKDLSHYNLKNVEHTAGNLFIKTKGGADECDAIIETEEFNVQSITITPSDLQAKIIVEIFGEDEANDFIMVMQNSIATIGDGGLSDDVAMYHDGDILSLQITAGSVFFLKNGETFHADEIGDVIAGRGKVTLCAAVGETVHVDFGVIDASLV